MMISDPYLIAVGLIGTRQLTDALLEEVMSKLPLVLPDADAEILERTRKQLEATVGISMSSGEGLHDAGQDPWLADAKSSLQWNYWDAYQKHLLASGWPREVLRVLDEDTDNILNECGNPQRAGSWLVRGLVMGDVQSGKTASYCGLINKAADAGYRFIVLLTGMMEDLRSQTQERLDEGFVGRDSRAIIGGTRPAQKFGAGRFREAVPNVLTSVESDFLTANAKALGGIPLKNIQQPVLLVMKKNKTPLTKLLEFIDSQKGGRDRMDLPMLLLDDEADNASVNARKDEDPATINRLIRDVLGRFSRSTYVAYTATPFANVFINPDYDDLFPANFVYSLNTPNNYIGIDAIFGEDARYGDQLVDITDAEPVFPKKQKKGWDVTVLPESLKDAVLVFLLSCAIRDLRREPLRHRSMLVNVTTLTSVQNRVAELLKNYLYDIQEEIKQYLSDDEIWRKHESLARLHALWGEHYSQIDIEWDVVRTALYDSVASVKVLTVNQETAISDKLNYSAYKDTDKGRRVIAVGGLTLSRGLTLEGLCVSYFYRNSRAYDTLLQMGRWFGYRPGYEDLFRIWMDSGVQDYFSEVAEVVAELRTDIRRMHIAGQPPRLFGIRVRSDAANLLVTALTKMRNAQQVEVDISFSRFGTETPYLPRTIVANGQNLAATQQFLQDLSGGAQMGTRYVWSGVKADRVAGYLAALQIPTINSGFVPDLISKEIPLIEFIRSSGLEEIENWDVCLVSGAGAAVPSLSIEDKDNVFVPRCRVRQFEKVPLGAQFYRINKQRVGDVSDELVGLSEDDVAKADEEWQKLAAKDGKKGKSVPAYFYRNWRRRPLLTVHLIEPGDPDAASKRASKMVSRSAIEPQVLLGVSLSLPDLDGGREIRKPIKYRLNKVALQNMGLLDDEDED